MFELGPAIEIGHEQVAQSGSSPAGDHGLLLESSSYWLLESGDNILLES